VTSRRIATERSSPRATWKRGLQLWCPVEANANDYSGNGRNGTVTGALLTFDEHGRTNRAYAPDGVDDIISHPDHVYTDPAAKRMSAFIRLVEAIPAAGSTVFAHYQEGSNQRSWWLGTGPSGSEAKLRLITYAGTSTVLKDYRTTADVFDNTAHHVGFVFDAYKSGDNLIIYVDGKRADVSKTTDNAMTSIFNSTAPITVGAAYAAAATPAYFWLGIARDWSLHNRPLTPAEIAWKARERW
jgi:hypothetical protein